MGMSSLMLDFEEKFWDYAQEIISECESFKEFYSKMFKFDDITTTYNIITWPHNELEMFWNEFWVDKQ
jgi:hypothetical protein